MKQDQWYNDLRKRMEDYSEPVPADLWNQLEQELNDLERPKTIPFWKRWQAVAAAVVVAVASSSLWLTLRPSSDSVGLTVETPQPEKMVENITENSSVSTLEDVFPSQEKMRQDNESSYTTVRKSSPLVAQQIPTHKQNEMVGEHITTDQQVEVVTEKALSEKQENAVAKDEKSSVVEQKPVRKTYQTSSTQPTVYPSSKNRKGWTVDIYSGGGQMSSNSVNDYRVFSSMAYASKSKIMYDEGSLSMPIYSDGDYYNAGGSSLVRNPLGYAFDKVVLGNSDNNHIETEYKHKTPVTFGMSLRFYLDEKWALETGLMYTLLSSDLHSGSNDNYYTQEQRLHYVGIPVKASRTLWENKRFDIYASAGGAVEKCVSGTLESVYTLREESNIKSKTDLDIDRLQWSVSGAVGAQLHLTNKLGAYVEPGVNYYFDDGTNIQTIRKEHPLNFNLKLGLRLNIGR